MYTVFKVYSSLVFSIFIRLSSHQPLSSSITFHLPQKKPLHLLATTPLGHH